MASILIVDDRPSNREFLATLLRYKGHELIEAADGEEALELVRKRKPELIITDILMPTMDGYEFVRRLRANPALAGAAVIFCTAHYHEREAQKLAQDCGVLRILTKPCEPEQVLRVVDEALGLGATPAAAGPNDAFDREHLRLLTDKLSEKVSELNRANLRFEALVEILLRLASERKPRRLLEEVCRGARDLIGAKHGLVAVPDPDNASSGYFVTSGMDPGTLMNLGPPQLQQGPLATLLEGNRPCRLHTLLGDPRVIGFPAGYPPIHSLLGAPIASEDHRYGWLFLTDKLGADRFSDDDEQLASILAAQLGRSYQNRRLYAQLQDRAHELEKEAAERKQVEAEVLKLNQSLEERVAARTAELASANIELDAFAHSVSHDLRAPLRHVLGYADLLKGGLGPAVDEKSRHYLDCVMASVEGMGQLIDDLLEFSRLGRAEMRRGMADLNQLVREVLHDLEGDSKGRDIAWKIAPLPQVQGDPAMLRLVLTNLIGNALKYTRPRAQAEIEIGCAPGEGHETIVFIRDNGVGFNPEYADKLFGVFQRLHLAEDFEGTGIGLANVRRIIQRHGGRTWAEGAVDAGATFYFSLPEMTQKQAENALGKDF